MITTECKKCGRKIDFLNCNGCGGDLVLAAARSDADSVLCAAHGSTSLVFSSLARKVKFALERGELGVSDPEDAWSKAYFLNRAETDQLHRWLNREANDEAERQEPRQ